MDVTRFITKVLVNEHTRVDSYFVELLDYEDGHYRVLFDPGYFVLQEGQAEPTKSQWNSLKKKLKRHDQQAFVFKAHGTVGGPEPRYYLDFGFLAES